MSSTLRTVLIGRDIVALADTDDRPFDLTEIILHSGRQIPIAAATAWVLDDGDEHPINRVATALARTPIYGPAVFVYDIGVPECVRSLVNAEIRDGFLHTNGDQRLAEALIEYFPGSIMLR